MTKEYVKISPVCKPIARCLPLGDQEIAMGFGLEPSATQPPCNCSPIFSSCTMPSPSTATISTRLDSVPGFGRIWRRGPDWSCEMTRGATIPEPGQSNAFASYTNTEPVSSPTTKCVSRQANTTIFGLPCNIGSVRFGCNRFSPPSFAVLQVERKSSRVEKISSNEELLDLTPTNHPLAFVMASRL